MSTSALAQDLSRPVDAAPPASPAEAPAAANDEMSFTADQLLYDNERDVVTAEGNVVAKRQGNMLRADMVTWDRKSNKVTAKGDVSIVNPNGDTAYGDVVDVTDTLRDGVIQGLLLVTQDGDRLAAERGERKGAIFILHHAAYTACAVVDDHGCPKEPTWQIKAANVVYDSDRELVHYSGARVTMFGVPLLPLPGLTHPVGNRGGSGLLVPNAGVDALNGGEISLPYYFRLAPNRDLIVTPHIYTDVLPMMEGQYRALVDKGAYAVTGYATYGRRTDVTGTSTSTTRAFRGYIDASGKLQLDENWSISGSLRRATDKTFLSRYYISRDDELRSTVNAERIGDRSYLSIAGWAFQTLRPDRLQKQVPIALPAVDYRLRMKDPWVGGVLQIQANSLSIIRTAGQDSQRAFVSAQWTLSRLTPLGQEIGLTAFTRGDIYHSSANQLTSTASYRGDPGWQTRGIAELAVDMRWAFVGALMGGTQRITPRIQIVAAPRLANLSVPNEDSRSVDLEDSNLFALNRFPGYDRYEDSSRVTYGVDYSYDRPYFSLKATVGQSYRLSDRRSILPSGTGLSDRFSDFVGRWDLRYRDFVTLTQRFRLDKNTLSVRRNEVDVTMGSRKTYAQVSYVRLNRNVTSGIEDLRDLEEMRLGGRIAFARNWSLFGSTTVDLTDKTDDPTSQLDGYTPVRHRVGIAYQNECVDLGLTWQREYQSFGDARRGNSFLVRLAFRNLGI